ncbi:MAG: T9SS type A sorting domain-containing protein [Ignavibacteriaceae bacterium]|nr:T9SS type A sorting domain-containing protein [Ignavibacteriaceae bacterium]
MKTLFLFALFLTSSAFAQITITSTDVSNVFAVGNSATIHSTDITSFDIGSAGGGNNWDFSGLQSTETFSLLSVDVATTPYASEFPGANLATYSQGEYGGYPAEIWSYLSINGSLSNLGQAVTSDSLPGVLVAIKDVPSSIELQLPMSLNTSWSQSYTETVYFGGVPISQTSISINVVVDAWGTMTMPGGAGFDALRIRETSMESGNTSVQYSFLAKNGANVTVSATDPNPPSSGVINADWYDWNLSFTTDVKQISGLPQDFNISQNYPNPFNPTTNIEYSIPEASFVQLKVFDILGNEVVTLVNEEQSAGSYRVDFSGVDFASGLYIAKLQAENYTKTIKMSLLK